MFQISSKISSQLIALSGPNFPRGINSIIGRVLSSGAMKPKVFVTRSDYAEIGMKVLQDE